MRFQEEPRLAILLAPLLVAAGLGEGWAIHYYDQRGCGRSSRPIDRFDSPDFLANVRCLVGALGLGAQIADVERIRRILGEEKIVLVGHSFGALLASLYAAEFPERVRALILVAPADALVMPSKREGLFDRIGKRIPPAERQAYGRFLAEYFNFGGIFSKSEAELAAVNRRMGRFFPEALGRRGLDDVRPLPQHGDAARRSAGGTPSASRTRAPRSLPGPPIARSRRRRRSSPSSPPASWARCTERRPLGRACRAGGSVAIDARQAGCGVPPPPAERARAQVSSGPLHNQPVRARCRMESAHDRIQPVEIARRGGALRDPRLAPIRVRGGARLADGDGRRGPRGE